MLFPKVFCAAEAPVVAVSFDQACVCELVSSHSTHSSSGLYRFFIIILGLTFYSDDLEDLFLTLTNNF